MDKRIILFRGKRVDNGEWVYGNLVKHNNGCLDFERYDIFTGHSGWGFEPSLSFERYEIMEHTVGQFIGREDMNRNKIFKDDLLSTKKRDVLFQVVLDNESCGFKFKSIETGTLFEIDSSVEKLEVIGNIHEKGK